MAQLFVTLAEKADLDSLSTVVARAFHKNNEYFRTTLPDTPLMRQWWYDLLRDAILDEIYQVLTIIDHHHDERGHRAVGILLLRRIDADDAGENVFDRHPPTSDHDQARWAAMLSPTVGGPREKLMKGRCHFSLDLFGVDDRYQGTGLGKKLLQKACEIADHNQLDVFVQANVYAKAFYEKRGFHCVDKVILRGPEKYGEAFLIYKAGKSVAKSERDAMGL